MDYQKAKEYIYANMFMQLLTAIADDDIKTAIEYIKEDTSCDDNTAKLIWCDLKMDYGTKENNPILQARENYEKEKQIEEFQYSNIPKCPTCGSTNIEKIGGIERGASVAMWGLFSKKINKTFKCKNCGYTW